MWKKKVFLQIQKMMFVQYQRKSNEIGGVFICLSNTNNGCNVLTIMDHSNCTVIGAGTHMSTKFKLSDQAWCKELVKYLLGGDVIIDWWDGCWVVHCIALSQWELATKVGIDLPTLAHSFTDNLLSLFAHTQYSTQLKVSLNSCTPINFKPVCLQFTCAIDPPNLGQRERNGGIICVPC